MPNETKFIEIRDRATFIPALAIRLDPDTAQEITLCRRVGYALIDDTILMMLNGRSWAFNDPYDWKDSRTMKTAHDHIIKNWSAIKSGDVVDVEFILGEKAEPSIPEKDEPKDWMKP
jgi:hypothetical protein